MEDIVCCNIQVITYCKLIRLKSVRLLYFNRTKKENMAPAAVASKIVANSYWRSAGITYLQFLEILNYKYGEGY